MTAISMPTLRPLGIGELLDQAIRLYRRNFLSFIGIIAVVQLPLGLLQFVLALLTLPTNPLFGGSARNPADAAQLSPLYWATTADPYGLVARFPLNGKYEQPFEVARNRATT